MIKEGELIFNNKSTLDLNLRLEEYPTISACNEEYEVTKISGADGDHYINLDTYPDVQISCNFDIFSNDIELDSVKVQKWLRNIEDNRLWFDQDEKCYLVKKVLDGDRFKESRNILNEPITFICKPFRWALKESKITINLPVSGGQFNKAFYSNTELPTPAKVVIWTAGSSETKKLLFNFNGKETIIEGVENLVTLDTNTFEVYEGLYNNRFSDLDWTFNGPFPYVINGRNFMRYLNETEYTADKISKVEITYRERYY